MRLTKFSTRAFLLTLLIALCAGSAMAQLGNFVITTPDLPDGTVGQSYTASLQTAGGMAPITFSVTSGTLPPGIGLTSAGVFTGTPTSGGFYSFTVQARDSLVGAVQIATKSFSIYVYSVITVSPASLTPVPVGAPLSIQLSASGGSAPYYYTFDSQTSQPYPWLSLSESGLLTGTPPSIGSFPFAVRVWDQTESNAVKNYTLVVTAALSITTASLPAGTVGQPYTASLAATGGTPSYTYTLSQGALPPGVGLNTAGVFSGTPNTAGTYVIVARVTDSAGQSAVKEFSMVVQPPALNFTPATLPAATQNSPYTASFTPTGVSTGYAFTLQSGSMPQGLSLSSAGVIAGTPTTQGSYIFTVRLSQGSVFVDRVVQLSVNPPALNFSPTTLPQATLNRAYSASFTPVGVGSQYQFALHAGSLPPGLSLSTSGVVSGTPSALGSYSFTVRLVSGESYVDQAVELVVTVPPLTLSQSSLPEGTTGQAYSAALTAEGGAPPYSFSPTGGALPQGISLDAEGKLTGTPSAAGTYQFSAMVNDSANHSASGLFTIVVVDPLALGPESLPAAKMGEPFDVQLQPRGGNPPYSYQVSGSLPGGITFNNGLFSGIPTAPGIYPIVVKLMDSRGRTLERPYRLAVPSNVQITTASPLPSGVTGQPYSATFAAADGVAPYVWTVVGNLPDGITLDSTTGVMSGQPTAFGSRSFGITVKDATEATAVKTFTVEFALPPVPPASITQIGPTAGPAQQPAFGLRLSQAFPVALNGLVTLTFAPDRFGDDPAVLFANGSRTMAFTIPAGQQTADFGSILAALQTGTVAGNITLTAALLVDGRDVTPSPAPRQTVRITPMAPTISRLELTRTGGGFELVVTGYSTPRQMTQAVVKLTPASGQTIATGEFTIPLESAFTSYYSGSASTPYGSQFRLVIPFFVPQGLSGLSSVSVTLANQVGSSPTSSVNF